MGEMAADADAGPSLEDEAAEQEREQALALRRQKLEALALSLAKSRSDAIAARLSSGIETEWMQDEEYYEGIDDANRGDMAAWRSKPPGQTTESAEQRAQAASVFINITRPYVDAAASRVGDMLLPTDDRAWEIKPTPIPELEGMAKGNFPPQVLRQALAANNGNADLAKAQLHKAVDQAVASMTEARKRAASAQSQIEDWHVECQFHNHARRVIDDAAKVGSGVLKGPFPTRNRGLAFMDGALVLKDEIQPASIRVDYWNFYPDPACGENIHNGSHCWERDDISKKSLMDLIDHPGYMAEEIMACLEEGPMRASSQAPERQTPSGHKPDTKSMFEIWYFHGLLEREDLDAIGCECEPGEHPIVAAEVTMVNNRIIKAIPCTIPNGGLPYDVMVWQRRAGSWAGIGVARQIRTPQEIVVGAGRNLLDNAGRAGGPQLVIQQGIVVPHDGIYEVTPWKIWLAGTDADLEHIDKAFRFVTIPALQQELMAIIQLGLKLAEDVTGLPLLLQGQKGSSPETLGGQQMAMNNASSVLRREAKLFDDLITEPHIRRYYAFLMLYGEDEHKGDFQIDARGSSALVQRDIENQAIAEMAKVVVNPIFGIDPKKWAEEWLKSKHLDAKRFQFDDEKWQQVVSNMAKGGDPRLAVAQLQAELKVKITQMEQAFEADQNNRDRELKMMVAQIDAQLAQAGLTSDQQKVLAEIKGRLSDTVLRLRAQREMQIADQQQERAIQVIEPRAEPKGKAPDGKAFIQ
jgi:hypothetical protein